jgi:transposase
MECGQVHEMPLSKRVFQCSCNGLAIDRDLHAARNILRQGLPNVKPVERGALASTQVEVKLLSRKQEINKKFNGLRTHSSFL